DLALTCVCFACLAHSRAIHSFPPRRSSDLRCRRGLGNRFGLRFWLWFWFRCRLGFRPRLLHFRPRRRRRRHPLLLRPRLGLWLRSEEHTSELQSREKLVCRLLLEKTKTKPC